MAFKERQISNASDAALCAPDLANEAVVTVGEAELIRQAIGRRKHDVSNKRSRNTVLRELLALTAAPIAVIQLLLEVDSSGLTASSEQSNSGTEEAS